MLQQAKYSFAVAEAQDAVKANAQYLCASNKDLGVIDVIKDLLDNEDESPEMTFEKYRIIHA